MLRGARPEDTPAQQPANYTRVTDALLAEADEVIK